MKSTCGELVRQVNKLTDDNKRIREKANNLQKQMGDLMEATKRVRVERETKSVRVPRITRNVGIQVNQVINKPVTNQKEEIVLDDDSNESISQSTSTSAMNGGDHYPSLPRKEVVEEKVVDNSRFLLPNRSPPDITEGLIELKVKKADSHDGIVITWDCRQTASDFNPKLITSYELEGSKAVEASAPLRWARIGAPINPLPLPMACNLNNFKKGVNYYFRLKVINNLNISYSNVTSIIL